MIDFDRFWAEPGSFPGMTRDEAEAQLQQMGAWLESMPGASGKFDLSAVPGMTAAPGVTAQQVAAWEADHGVTLPPVLREALLRRNGGFVRETQFRILPLEEIENPDEEFWEWAAYEETDVPDRALVFRFAEDECGGECLLVFGPGEMEREPAVFEYHSDGGDLGRCSKSITRFLSRMLETSESPSVDWSEAANVETVARETIDLSPIHGGPAEKELVLGRLGGALILFEHEKSPAGESYSKTTLPEPLLKQAAMLQPCRPAPVSTYSLVLQPENTEAIVRVASQRTSDGQWKNGTSQGTPICVLFESTDRGRLEGLRRNLIGKKAADCSQAVESSQQKLQSTIAALSPDERQSAMFQMMLQMRERMESMHLGGAPLPPDAPPDLAALHESLQQKLRDAQQRAQEHISKNPLGPEIMRQIGEINPQILKLFGTDMESDADDEPAEP